MCTYNIYSNKGREEKEAGYSRSSSECKSELA